MTHKDGSVYCVNCGGPARPVFRAKKGLYSYKCEGGQQCGYFFASVPVKKSPPPQSGEER